MNPSTPYTRKAVQLIRNGATALDLGWSGSMYASVCATHGIACAAPAKAPAPKPEALTPLRRRSDLDFRQRSGEIVRASVIVALSPVQAEAFGVLYERYVAGEQNFISAFDISGKLKKECSARNIVNMIARVNDRLAPLRCWIEVKAGRDGGYRLRVEA